MKKRAAGSTKTVTIVCLVFFLFFLIHHEISLSSIFKSSTAIASLPNTNHGQDLKYEKSHWKVDPLLEQPSKLTAVPPPPTSEILSCDRTHDRYDICYLNGPTTMDPIKSTFYMINPTTTNSSSIITEKIRPYPRKWETNLMKSHVKELTITLTTSSSPNSHDIPYCQVQHKSPALVFSSGGYTGNLYHDFDDGFIPLFVTLRTLRTIFPDQQNGQPILVISKCNNWWLSKYSQLLKLFTPHPIINLDNETDIHCFPSTTIGLISHGYMTINSTLLPNSETLRDFRAFLETAYAKTGPIIPSSSSSSGSTVSSTRPRLVLVGRTGEHVGRVMVNQAEVVLLANEVGFEVTIFEPTPLTSISEAYGLMNKSHAMVGVHGAAMTHLLFLRPGSVFIQVVPIGTDWPAETCYGKPAKEIGLEYVEYKVKMKESSLLEKYGKDNLVLSNPKEVTKGDWSNTKNIYLKEQDVRVDLVRFGKYLRKAFKKAKKFMDKEG